MLDMTRDLGNFYSGTSKSEAACPYCLRRACVGGLSASWTRKCVKQLLLQDSADEFSQDLGPVILLRKGNSNFFVQNPGQVSETRYPSGHGSSGSSMS